jgi:hypothetical protein
MGAEDLKICPQDHDGCSRHGTAGARVNALRGVMGAEETNGCVPRQRRRFERMRGGDGSEGDIDHRATSYYDNPWVPGSRIPKIPTMPVCLPHIDMSWFWFWL